MTEQRRQRQRREILTIGRSGQLARAIALARDHLMEFPADVDLAAAVLEDALVVGDDLLLVEARALSAPSASGVTPSGR